MDNPIITILGIILGSAFLAEWINDFKQNRKTPGKPKGRPGAVPCGSRIILIAVAGSLAILWLECTGENMLGVSSEQSDMSILFGIYTLLAAFLEELIFRGYLVITEKGKAVLWLGIFAFSFLFAMVHPYIWNFDNPYLLELTPKALLSTGIVFINSLWFYSMRFNPLNKKRSLLPCIAAHFASNLGVFLVKLIQGHVSGLL